MFSKLIETIEKVQRFENISTVRKAVLQPLIENIQSKYSKNQVVNLNFICTHNSRRSHLTQIWAQVAAAYYSAQNINCYSGGTVETALFPKVAETFANQGFEVVKITENSNPIYVIKFDDNALPVIGFSKKYDHPFNPKSNFIAIMTCSQADNGCPFISGAEKRIALTYEDPKISDGTTEQTQVYTQRSLEIATEMFYVFSQIK
jgi:arsenate reductase